MLEINKVHNMSCLDGMKLLDDNSIDCIVTSPPYWGLRDYGKQTETVWDGDVSCEHDFSINATPRRKRSKEDVKNPNSVQAGNKGSQHDLKDTSFCSKCGAWKGQLGLEPDFNLYIKHLCDIFDEVKRVLKPTGTCWVNIGDTYNTTQAGNTKPCGLQQKTKAERKAKSEHKRKKSKLPDKCLLQIPSRFAIEMCNRGWTIRNEIIWYKKNVLPSSVRDRLTVDFEKIFFFVKNKKYYFEQQFEPQKDCSIKRAFAQNHLDIRKDKDKQIYAISSVSQDKHFEKMRDRILECETPMRNMRCVWEITTKPFKDAHFAVFSEDLITTPIKAGCPEFICKKCDKPRERIFEKVGTKPINQIGGVKQSGGFNPTYSGNKETPVWEQKGYSDCGCNVGFKNGIVLDPFAGSGTTGLTARKLLRNFIGFEINPTYCAMANKRINSYPERLEKWGLI